MKKELVILLFTFHFSLFTLSAQGLWTKKTSYPDTACGGGTCFTIDSYGYVGLGYNPVLGKVFNELWQFNPSTNSWTQKANFPGNIQICPTTFVIGHKAYVVTGADKNTNYLAECWVYDANIDTWTQKNNFPGQPRAYGIGFSIGDKGFIGLGSKYDSAYCKDFWEYDTTSDTWTQKANFGGVARYEPCGFSVGNKGYVCFGLDTVNGAEKDIWEYDTTTDLWTQKTNYPGSGVYGANGFVIGNDIYIGTGIGDYWLGTFWKYNTVTDSWQKQSKFPSIDPGYPFSFAVADSGYLGLGVDSLGNGLKNFYKFYPDTLTGINEATLNDEVILLSPNPNNGIFNIVISNIKHQISNIDIYNMLGERVYEKTIPYNQKQYSINFSDATTGVYLLKVYTIDGRVSTSKLIIIK